jgi:hypothetical protein
MARVTGLWVYQTLGDKPDPEAVAAAAERRGMRWITAQATEGDDLLDRDWLAGMRRATTRHGLKLGVHGFIGRPTPKPVAEARAMAKAIDVADADFAIVNAEIQYEKSPNPDSTTFVKEYRRLKPEFRSYFSSFGRPAFHPGLNWQAWADGGFRGMPQAYENLNPSQLRPTQCVADYARFFPKRGMQVTLGCFEEHGKPHLPVTRLVQSVADVPGGMTFNVFRHGTVTNAELKALAGIA